MRTTSCRQLVTTSTHTAATHARNRLNLALSPSFIDQCNQVHVVLGIEQAGIHFIFDTPEFEHVNTFGEKQP